MYIDLRGQRYQTFTKYVQNWEIATEDQTMGFSRAKTTLRNIRVIQISYHAVTSIYKPFIVYWSINLYSVHYKLQCSKLCNRGAWSSLMDITNKIFLCTISLKCSLFSIMLKSKTEGETFRYRFENETKTFWNLSRICLVENRLFWLRSESALLD